jgi:hypothetical protein
MPRKSVVFSSTKQEWGERKGLKEKEKERMKETSDTDGQGRAFWARLAAGRNVRQYLQDADLHCPANVYMTFI